MANHSWKEEIFVCGSNRRRALDGCFRDREEEEEEEDITEDFAWRLQFLAGYV